MKTARISTRKTTIDPLESRTMLTRDLFLENLDFALERENEVADGPFRVSSAGNIVLVQSSGSDWGRGNRDIVVSSHCCCVDGKQEEWWRFHWPATSVGCCAARRRPADRRWPNRTASRAFIRSDACNRESDQSLLPSYSFAGANIAVPGACM
jgi:hypothetical protein